MAEHVKNGTVSDPDVEMSNDSDNNIEKQAAEKCENNVEGVITAVPMERSQTDQLNKKLLCSYLEKINQSSSEPIIDNDKSPDENSFDD